MLHFMTDISQIRSQGSTVSLVIALWSQTSTQTRSQ